MKAWIIDDDISLARLIAYELKKRGHQIDIFSSSQKALDENETPDVIIVDGNLSQDEGEWSRGEVVVKKLREKYGPSLIIAAHSSDRNDSMMAQGADVAINKGSIDEFSSLMIHPYIYSLIRKYNKADDACVIIHHGRDVGLRALDLLPDGDETLIWEASLLHDIAFYLSDPMITHGWVGAEILRKEGWPRHALITERHVGVGLTAEQIKENNWPLPAHDMIPISPEEKAICWADAFFSKGRSRELTMAEVEEKMRKIDKLEEFDRLRCFFHGA